jgi:hypothetical protein
MNGSDLKLLILSLLAFIFAGYHIACACSHPDPHVSSFPALHQDVSVQAPPCHEKSHPDQKPETSHTCPHVFDSPDTTAPAFASLPFPRLKAGHPVGVERVIQLQSKSVRWLHRMQYPPPHRRHETSQSPVSLKVRLLN